VALIDELEEGYINIGKKARVNENAERALDYYISHTLACWGNEKVIKIRVRYVLLGSADIDWT